MGREGERERGRVGEWESGRGGEWESGRGGEWERGRKGRVGEWESGREGEWEKGSLVVLLCPSLPHTFRRYPDLQFLDSFCGKELPSRIL